MERPWLVQRCKLEDGRLVYDYMGSAEFEMGCQPKSLKRIFSGNLAIGLVKVTVNGKKIPVYMFAALEFPFGDYQPYLQQLADNSLRLQEQTDFDAAVKIKAGLPAKRLFPQTNVWFDFRNDVLWTLDENCRRMLLAVLRNIEAKWAAK